MVVEEYGFRKTEVDGTPFTIKKNMCGTRSSVVGRRLACVDEVTGVDVDYEGNVGVHIRADDTFTIGFGNSIELSYVPDDFGIQDVIVHDSDKAAAHVTFTEDADGV